MQTTFLVLFCIHVCMRIYKWLFVRHINGDVDDSSTPTPHEVAPRPLPFTWLHDSDLQSLPTTDNDKLPTTPLHGVASSSDDERRRLYSELNALTYRYHMHHPFEALLRSGRVSRDMLRFWVANMCYYEDIVQRKDALIVAQCPHLGVRATLLAAVLNDDIDGALGQCLQLARALDVVEEDEMQRLVLPATKFVCDAYYAFCRDATWQDGMCSTITDLFASRIHKRQHVVNWTETYPWLPKDALGYLETRVDTLDDEVETCVHLIASYFCASEARMTRAREVVKFKQDVSWTMLDGLWHNWFARECRIPTTSAPSPHTLQSEDESDDDDDDDTPRPQSRGAAVLRVLGSGAGSGVPQWNRHDELNDRARHGCGTTRTQSSYAVSSDCREWVLINCSTDFGVQWNALVRAHPNATLRALILTDNQLHNVGGLLSLRDSRVCVDIYCSPDIQGTIEPLLALLKPYTQLKVHNLIGPLHICGIELTPVVLGKCKAPYTSESTTVLGLHISVPPPHAATKVSDVVAAATENKVHTVFLAPCIPTLDEIEVFDVCRHSSTVLFDGTFLDAGDTSSGIYDGDDDPMGTVCAIFHALGLRRPIFVRTNDTSHRHTPECEAAYDGMEIDLY